MSGSTGINEYLPRRCTAWRGGAEAVCVGNPAQGHGAGAAGQRAAVRHHGRSASIRICGARTPQQYHSRSSGLGDPHRRVVPPPPVPPPPTVTLREAGSDFGETVRLASSICGVAGGINTSAIIRPQHRKARIQRRCREAMHAKHADNSELNELSGRVIGGAFTALNMLGPSLNRSTLNRSPSRARWRNRAGLCSRWGRRHGKFHGPLGTMT